MLARLGGDEFICVMESVRSDEEVAMLAQEVIAAFDSPFRIGGQDLFLSASVGVSENNSPRARIENSRLVASSGSR